MKRHVKINGRLLQTDKDWRDLKEKQKCWIAEKLREEYLKVVSETNRATNNIQRDIIISNLYSLIEDRGIWIPFYVIKNYACKKISSFNRKFLFEIKGFLKKCVDGHFEESINVKYS